MEFYNADHHLHLGLQRESMLLNCEMVQEDMLTSMHGLNNMASADLRASFLSLLSGPSEHMSCDLQHLLDPKPAPMSSQVSLNHRIANYFPAESRVSVLPSALWLHNMDCQNMMSQDIFFPLSLSNSTVNYNNSSGVLQGANLSFLKSQTVPCENTHDKDNVKSFSSLIGNNNVDPIPGNSLKLQKYADIAALQKVPVESNSCSYHQGHSSSSSFPRVFCSGISGNLYLSDIGLLGVVCACHGLFMSISKFSEHSGSCHVNPGNAIRMDSGQTVAHWWKIFSSKSGIRVLEGHGGWDWPEGISAAAGLTSLPISNKSNNSVLMDQVACFRTPVSYEQQQCTVINSKGNQSCKNVANGYPYHENDRTSQECGNSLFKYFINSSHGNLLYAPDQQICRTPNSFGINTEKASQSTAANLGPVCGNTNSVTVLPKVQGLATPCNGFSVSRNTSFTVKGPRVSSDIDLRLGQPPEQSQPLETKVLPAFGSNLNCMHAEPLKLFSPELLQKSNKLQGSKWTLQHADITSKPNEGRRPSQFENSGHVGGAYCVISDCPKDASRGNLEMTDLNLMLLSCLRNPETKWQATGDTGSERLHFDSHASKNQEIGFPWSTVAGKIEEYDNNVSKAQNHVNKGNEVEYAVNGLLGATKPNIELCKTFEENLSYLDVLSGKSSFNKSPAFHEKNPNLYHSSMIVDETHGRDILNNCCNVYSVSDNMHFNHDPGNPIRNSISSKDTVSMGFTFKNSNFVQNATPTLSKKKCNGINPCFQDENMKMPAVQNISAISNRDHGPASIINVQECETVKKPHVQSLLTIAPSISEDHVHLLDSSRTPKIPEVEERSMVPNTISWMGHDNERFGTDCDLPPVEQLFLRPGALECNFTLSKKVQCSQELPYVNVPEKCICAVQANCLTEEHALNGHICHNLVKEGDRGGGAASLFPSRLNENCIFLKDRGKSFEETESLVGPDIKRVESHSFQWCDVPKKIMESCSSTRKEQQAGLYNASFRDAASDAAKGFAGFARNVSPFKEHELSNISSRCSAPDVIQSSIEVNKKDSYTVAGGDIRCADNLVLDEGSENYRSWSSDDAFDNEHCAEFSVSASRMNLIKRRPFKPVPGKPSLSLIEEIRHQNSLRFNNAPFHIKRSSTIQEESDQIQKFEIGQKKKRKTVKWMKLDATCPASGQSFANNKSPKCTEEVEHNSHSLYDKRMPDECDHGSPIDCADSVKQSSKLRNSVFSAAKGISLKRDLHKVYHRGEQQTEEAHKSPWVDDTSEASGTSRKKRFRLDDASARSKEIQEKCCSSVELTAELTSLGCSRNSLGKPNFYEWMARPIVFGKYGIISNGNPSKPAKIIPLRKIFKTTAAYAEKSKRNSYDNEKLKSRAVKVKNTGVRHVKETSLSKKVLKNQVRKGGARDSLSIELVPHDPPHDPSWEIGTTLHSATNGSDNLSCTSQECNTHGITNCKPGVKLKTKFKEGRKRSLHELLIKGNGFAIVNSSAVKNSISLCQTTSRYWGKLIGDDVSDKVQRDHLNNTNRCSQKHQFENPEIFSCVCGSNNKDECNQLLECNRFLVKGLRSEADAVNNGNASFYGRYVLRATPCIFIPDDESGSSQPAEKFLTCARTEGYKGRKREGFLHNRPQDANGNAGCLVPQEQLNAWLHIHRQKPQQRGHLNFSSSNVESDCRVDLFGKAYTRYKQLKGWKHLVVYKSRIHALGLYTSQFISRGAMVVEYVGEIVGLRVADRRENEYHSGKKLQHKSACYFFRIDKERIIDATRRGGIARFVNHSCEPNCAAKVISVRNEKKVVFFAERDIYPGEEITYDYHFNHEDEGEKIPCYCNSKNCRRYLN